MQDPRTSSVRWFRRSRPFTSKLAAFTLACGIVACAADTSDNAGGQQAATGDEDELVGMNSENFWTSLKDKLATITDVLAGPGAWTTPDKSNRWSKGFAPTRVGQENILPNDVADFQKMATDIQQIQGKLLASNNGAVARAFHAKPHACVKGTFFPHVSDDAVKTAHLPEKTALGSLKVGLFSDTTPHEVWVRWSNGVGGSQRPDGEVDVRGLAFKVLGVKGSRLPNGAKFFQQEADTQDFLMTNGATTPAPNSETFAAFGVSQANMAAADGVLAKGTALKDFFKYLVANPRVGSTLVHKAISSTKNHNSVLAQQFFSGGAIALGVDASGAPLQAVKFNAITGVWKGDTSGKGTCTPATDEAQALADFAFPGGAPIGPKGDPNYLSTGPKGVKSVLKQAPICIDFRLQFQPHDAALLSAQAQPIEDTTVEWRESDAPSVSVATVVIQKKDDPSGEEAVCNELAWNPWHGLVDHRPLGNIMRARQEVLAASAQKRKAQDVH
jgi:hypothetical protein